ncbi:MAG: hypothetical protein K2K29_01795, partial [Muribaculaceae bacterium]|nr:hypothetical protein [Muribaculaceae bacterium]
IVICDSVMAAEFSELWERQLSKLHIPSEYGGRLIVLNQSEDKEVNYDCQSIHVMLGKFGITVNRISLAAGGENEKETAEKISRLIAFLSLSGNEFINGIIF